MKFQLGHLRLVDQYRYLGNDPVPGPGHKKVAAFGQPFFHPSKTKSKALTTSDVIALCSKSLRFRLHLTGYCYCPGGR